MLNLLSNTKFIGKEEALEAVNVCKGLSRHILVQGQDCGIPRSLDKLICSYPDDFLHSFFTMLQKLSTDYGYNSLDSFLVLKDILAGLWNTTS